MALTLADLAPVAADLELLHPITAEKLGVSLKVVGHDSAEFRAAMAAVMKKRVGGHLDPEDIVAQSNDMLASLVVGWPGDEFFGGPFSKEAASKIFANPGYAWLANQVDAFTKERANFFR